MGLTTINGLPAHALLVHLVVVLVPLAALLVILSAAWPAFRHRIGIGTPIVALVALIAVPITTNAGEWLEHHVDRDPLVQAHTELGDELLPWAIGLFVVAAAIWLWQRRADRIASAAPATVDGPGAAAAPASSSPRASAVVTGVLIVLALVVGVGSVVQVYRIGESGARAVWHDSFSPTPVSGPGSKG